MTDHRGTPQHVWVALSGRPDDIVPGLLLAWRQREPVGWEAWVIAVYPDPGAGVTEDAPEVSVRQSWIPASAVRPLH